MTHTSNSDKGVLVPRELTPAMRDVANSMANGGYDHANDFWHAMLFAATGTALPKKEPTVGTTLETARLIRNVFLPSNPNKMRKAAPEVVAAAKAFIAAVEAFGPTR